MRIIAVLLVLIIAAGIVDLLASGGPYRQTGWRAAAIQIDKKTDDVRRFNGSSWRYHRHNAQTGNSDQS